MADIPPLNVKVNIDASGVDSGVAKANAGLESISAKAKATTTSLGKFRTLALGVFGGNLLTAGVMGLTRALTDMRNGAIATEFELNRLDTVMANMGTVSEEQAKKIKDNVSAFSSLGFSGEESAAAMSNLLRITGDVSQSYKLMAMAADLARDKNIDLATAAQLLGRGTKGSIAVFKMYGIELDKKIPKNKALAKAFDELNAKIGGSAQRSTDTLAVKIAILREQFSTFADAIARVVIPVFSAIATALGAVASWVIANQTPLMILGGIVTTLIVVTKAWTATVWLLNAAFLANPIGLWIATIALVSVAFVKAWNSFKVFREAMAEGLSAIVQLLGYFVGGLASVARALSRLPGMSWLKGVADGADKAAVSIGKFGKSIEDLSKKKIKPPKMPTIKGSVKPGDPTGIKGDVLGGDKGGKGTVQYVTVYASNTNDIAKKLSKAAKNGQPIGGK